MHTPQQMKTIEEYTRSVDMDVLNFIEDTIKGIDRMNYITVAFFTSEATQTIKRLTSKNVEGSRIVLDMNAVNHIINRHGSNGSHDHSMMDTKDLARIGYVLSNYDTIEFNGVTTTGYLDENCEPSPMIKISKRIDGTYYVIETVNSSKRKRSYIITAYIKAN